MRVRIPEAVVLAAALISILVWTASPVIAAEKPNVVIMMVDNLG